MLKLGLTGGIGSGKSTIAGIFDGLGACIIDADAISRSVTAANGLGIGAIFEAFGASAITVDGAMDREWMRSLVFSDSAAKVRLEQIVHPLVGQEIARQTALAQAKGARCLVFDIPLLVESGHWRKNLDRVLVVDCTTDTQTERVMRRSGLAQSVVQSIIAAQSTRKNRLQAADIVIFNDCKSFDEIGNEVAWLAAQFGL